MNGYMVFLRCLSHKPTLRTPAKMTALAKAKMFVCLRREMFKKLRISKLGKVTMVNKQ